MKKVWIFWGVLLIILIASIAFLFSFNKIFNPEDYYSDLAGKIALSGNPVNCFDLPNNVHDPLDMMSMGYSPITSCVEKMAILYKNASVCDVYLNRSDYLEDYPLSPTSSRGNCRRELALFYNDSIYCGDDFCLFVIGEKQKNYSVCLKISNETTSRLNYNGYKASCLDNIAGYFNDSSICEYSENTKLETECKNIVFAHLAENNIDLEYCNRIQSTSGEKEECFEKVYTLLAISKENLSYCDKDELTEEGRANCYTFFAKKLKDITYCEKIPEFYYKRCVALVENPY
jgi:hypothetical protein